MRDIRRFIAYDYVTPIQLEEVISTQKPVVLFGAMGMGVYAKKALDFLNVKLTCFCDNSISKQGTLVDGVPVLSPLQVKETYPDAKIFICSFKPQNFEMIKNQLTELGFRDINRKDVLYDVYVKNCSNRFTNPSDADQLLNVFRNPQDKVILKLVNLVVTTKCTLHCKHCASLIPYFENPYNIDKNIIIHSIESLARSVDAIEELFLFGGEPLLHPDLEEICIEVSKIKNILRFYIITNGTILPKDSQIDIIKKCGFDLAISDYGELSRYKNEIIEIAKKHNIVLSVVDIDNTWLDLGNLKKRFRPQNENINIFKSCLNSPNPCYPLINGKFHICSRSGFGTEINAFGDNFEDYVDFSEGIGTDRKRKEILNLFNKKCIVACDCCDMALPQIVKPAIQTKKILEV